MKPKPVNVELITRENENGELRQPYAILDELVAEHHPDLADARIALAWRDGWTEDADGRLRLGQTKKASDLDRDLHGFDFVILLNHEVWNRIAFTERQMRALLDHELCHCAVAKDKNGEVKMDERGRPVWRLRKHDIEEFAEVVARHGLWRHELEKFVAVAMEKTKAPLMAEAEAE